MTGGNEVVQSRAAAGVVAAAACLSGAAIVALRPLLQRYAPARPNARSSHRTPTAQGSGLAVIAATILVSIAGSAGLGAGRHIVLDPDGGHRGGKLANETRPDR